jgi:hypothetical protein
MAVLLHLLVVHLNDSQRGRSLVLKAQAVMVPCGNGCCHFVMQAVLETLQ